MVTKKKSESIRFIVTKCLNELVALRVSEEENESAIEKATGLWNELKEEILHY